MQTEPDKDHQQMGGHQTAFENQIDDIGRLLTRRLYILYGVVGVGGEALLIYTLMPYCHGPWRMLGLFVVMVAYLIGVNEATGALMKAMVRKQRCGTCNQLLTIRAIDDDSPNDWELSCPLCRQKGNLALSKYK